MTQSSRRVYPRQHRRLAVRFWRPGEERSRQGFTKNVSLTGAFVSTPDPAGRGERLRLELSDGGRTAQLYAVVVHAHRVPPELRRFADSAMGVRFLGLDEVVGPFLGAEALQPTPAGEPAGRGAGAETGAFRAAAGSGAWRTAPDEVPASGGSGAQRVAGGGAGGEGAAAGGGEDAVGGAPPAGGGEWGGGSGTGAFRTGAAVGTGAFPAGGAAGSGVGAGGTAGGPADRQRPPLRDTAARPAPGPAVTYLLSFATADDFLAVYRRDVANGGLFVTAERPARLDERVAVDLRLPGAGAPTVRVEGRVVQVVEPRPLASGRTAGGMGLELIDPDGVLRRLAPHVAAYER